MATCPEDLAQEIREAVALLNKLSTQAARMGIVVKYRAPKTAWQVAPSPNDPSDAHFWVEEIYRKEEL